MTNILVVDNEEIICDAFKLALEPEDCVVYASCGDECIIKARMNEPDIIFLDLEMPGMNGIDTLIQLQSIYTNIPTLIMTGFYEEHMLKLEKARTNGCSFEVCHKPMYREQIKSKVREYKHRIKLKNEIADRNRAIKANNVCGIEEDEGPCLKLFIAGKASEYIKMIDSLRNMFDKNLKSYEFEVINVFMNPELAAKNNIIATPTIVKHHYSQPLMVIGDIDNSERVLSALNLVKNLESSDN